MEKTDDEVDRFISLRYQDTSYQIHKSSMRRSQYLEFGSQSAGIMHCEHGNSEARVGRRGEGEGGGLRVISVNQKSFSSVVCNIL